MRPFQRGFFCDDESLRYPYGDNTVSVPMLLTSVLLMPMLFIAVVEVVRICDDFQLRRYLRNLWRHESAFSFGFIATYLCSELTKRVVGRLRPHFYAGCQPRLPDGSSCDDVDADASLGRRYVEHYECTNRQMTASQLYQLQVSFPSGHSALSFFSMVFLCFYLHVAWRSRGAGLCRFLRHLLQFGLLMVALAIALSRIADYWHHWSDVLAGIVLGVSFAVLAAVYIGDLLRRPAERRTPRMRHCSTTMSDLHEQQQLVESPSDWKLQTVLTN